MDNYISLVNQRTKIEKQVEAYLEENSNLMDDVNEKHPVWKPYREFMNQYSKVVDQIRIIDSKRK